MSMDAFSLQIAWNGLRSICDEAFLSLMRSSFSTNIKERHDHSTAVLDAQGNFWCAEWGSSRVRAYAPDGSVLRDVMLPVSQPSCPAFGGPELRDLYVTTARQDLSEEALAAEPLAGQVFVATDIAQGQREHEVIL